jgi:hypothetical protein
VFQKLSDSEYWCVMLYERSFTSIGFCYGVLLSSERIVCYTHHACNILILRHFELMSLSHIFIPLPVKVDETFHVFT